MDSVRSEGHAESRKVSGPYDFEPQNQSKVKNE